MRTIFFFLIIFFSLSNYSQERKSFDAVRFISPPKIDGKLNDDQWIKSPELKDFILAFPSTRFGKKIPPDYETTAYFGYDDDAIYIAAKIKHPNMQKIQKELAVRDDAMNGDYELFWVSIDPYNNKDKLEGRLIINPHTSYFSEEALHESRTKACLTCLDIINNRFINNRIV